jgi:uncharacterized protein YdhG (YjbR/CyaY superfamily)
MNKPETIDEYTATFPDRTRILLEQVRAAIKQVAPEATETICYGIPTFQLDGKDLDHYGGFTSHIGFYATPDGHEEFEAELSAYKRGKGSVQFPLDKPLPLDLIRRIAQYRAEQLRHS